MQKKNTCAYYCVSASCSCDSSTLFPGILQEEKNSVEGHVITKHRRPRPHSNFCSCQWHLVLCNKPLVANRDQLGSCWAASLRLTTSVCDRKRRRRPGRSAANRFPLWLVSCAIFFPSVRPTALPASGCVCAASWMSAWERERERVKSPERKQKWSKGPFPTLFLAPVCPWRLKRTLPKQRDCLCRCPNSQPTHTCTLAHRPRHTHTPGHKKNVFLIPSKCLFKQLFSVNTGSDSGAQTFWF